MKRPHRKPTEAELPILQILWAHGPSTVREVAQALGRESAYTTVLKQLQILAEKRLVRRNESDRTHVYEAMYSEGATKQHLVSDLVERAFDGSAARLVMQLLSTEKASSEELAEIRRLLKKKTGGPQ